MESFEMIKGINDLRQLIDLFEDLRADAIKFIIDRGLKDDFFVYHTQKCLEREGRKNAQ